jgi:hypothetical protein
MANVSTGRKYFNITKNMESNDGIYYSNLYARERFSPDLPIVSRSPDHDIKQVIATKQLLIEKEEKLKLLKENNVKNIDTVKINPLYQDISNNSVYTPYQAIDIYRSHFKHLENQIQQKQSKKIDEMLEKQKQTKERLQNILALRELEIQERKKQLEKAEEYRKNLEIQQSVNSYIYESPYKSSSITPKHVNNSFVNQRSPIDYYSPEPLPKINKGQRFPSKNLSKLVTDYKVISGFNEPKFTKQNPKITISYPITGVKNPYNLVKQEI